MPGADGALAPVAQQETMTVETNLSASQIVDSFSPPETISFWALPGFIDTLEAAGFSAARHRLHWHAQLAQPLLFGAMVLIGAAFSMRPARLGGLGVMALWAVVTGFAFFFITDVAKALGASGAAPIALAAWAPPAAAALFAAGLLLHLEDG
jgi:lipopolysaccharide export system permease protein